MLFRSTWLNVAAEAAMFLVTLTCWPTLNVLAMLALPAVSSLNAFACTTVPTEFLIPTLNVLALIAIGVAPVSWLSMLSIAKPPPATAVLIPSTLSESSFERTCTV